MAEAQPELPWLYPYREDAQSKRLPAPAPPNLRSLLGDMDAPAASISVMLIVPDGEAAVAWYKQALGAEELWNLGGVAGLHVGGAPFFLHEVNPDNCGETDPGRAGVTSSRIEVFVDDPDSFIARALAAGATSRSAVMERRVP